MWNLLISKALLRLSEATRDLNSVLYLNFKFQIAFQILVYGIEIHKICSVEIHLNSGGAR